MTVRNFHDEMFNVEHDHHYDPTILQIDACQPKPLNRIAKLVYDFNRIDIFPFCIIWVT